MAVKSDKSTYLVTFGGFSCHDVRTMTDAGVRDADFAIDMSADSGNASFKVVAAAAAARSSTSTPLTTS